MYSFITIKENANSNSYSTELKKQQRLLEIEEMLGETLFKFSPFSV